MSLYNAYNSYTHAIYLNNVWLTVLLDMVCITYQYVVCNVCHKCTNIMLASFFRTYNLAIYLNNVWLTVLLE